MLKQKIREGDDDDEAVEVMKDTSAVIKLKLILQLKIRSLKQQLKD
jgi:hypothetical protein